MKKALSMIVLATASFGFVAVSHASPAELKATYDATKKKADADYKVAKEACSSHKDNAKDVCVKEAKAVQVKTTAEAEVAYKGTDGARKKARTDIADANYEVAKEKCDALTGAEKSRCAAAANK